MTNPSDPPRPRIRRVDAFVVSSDDSFLLELGPVLGDRFRARPAEHLADLQSPGDSKWLALIDGSQAGARALVNQIEQQHPRAPLIVVTPDGQQAQWNGALARGTVSAVVAHSQLNGPVMRDAIAMAEQRLGNRADAGASSTAEIKTLPGLPKGRVAAIAVAVVLLAGLGWYLLRGKTPAGGAPAAPAIPAAGTPSAAQPNAPNAEAAANASRAPQRSVLELLSLARVAFRDQDRLLPRSDGSKRGDSALELYAEVLTQDAENDEARDGMRRLFSVARSRMQSDLNAGRLEEAQRMLAIFKSAGVDADSARAMDADIKAAQPKYYLAQTRRAIAAGDVAAADQALAQLTAAGADRATLQDLRRAIDLRQADAQLVGMGEDVHAAIAAGALLEPAPTSARTRVMAMRQLSRTNQATVAAQRELQEALLARARDAFQAQQFDAARRLTASAAEFGSTPDIAELNRRIQTESEQASARAAATPAPTPAGSATTAATNAASEQAAFVIARATQPLSVVFPARADYGKLQGYVVVEFTLKADGSASDVTVIEAKPPGVFDRSATDAVKRGRFDTSVLGDDRQPRRARLRVSFKPAT